MKPYRPRRLLDALRREIRERGFPEHVDLMDYWEHLSPSEQDEFRARLESEERLDEA